MPRIRAALNVNQPPLMFIFNDPSHTEWGAWDIRLAKAYALREEMLSGGVPVYWDRSERVFFDVESYVSKSRAALDRAEERAQKGKKKNYGKVFYPVPRTIDDGPLPTLEEWLEEQRKIKERTTTNFRVKDGPFSNAGWKPRQEDD